LHREDIASITAMLRTDITAGYEDFLFAGKFLGATHELQGDWSLNLIYI